MSSENLSYGRSVYVRFALLIVGWLTAGLLLYALFTILPEAALGTIAIVAYAVVRFDRRKIKSLASLLCAITCSLTFVCAYCYGLFPGRSTFWKGLFSLAYVLERA